MSQRYALFGGPSYYPNGGADDFICWCDSVEAAKDEARGNRWCDWFQITDNDMVSLLIGESDRSGLTVWMCEHPTAVEVTEIGMTRQRYRCISCGKEWNGERINPAARSG